MADTKLTFKDPYTANNKKTASTPQEGRKFHFPGWLIIIALIVVAVFAIRSMIPGDPAKNTVSYDTAIVQTTAGPEVMMTITNNSPDNWMSNFTSINTVTYEDGSTHEYTYNYNGAIAPSSSTTIALDKQLSYPGAISVEGNIKDGTAKWYTNIGIVNLNEDCAIDKDVPIEIVADETHENRYDIWIDKSVCSIPNDESHELTIYYYNQGTLVYTALTNYMYDAKVDGKTDDTRLYGEIDLPEGLQYDSTSNILTSWTKS